MISINLIVLRSNNLTNALAFYHGLGLNFQKEQHGKGPIHYSTKIGQLTLELYPATAANPSTESLRIGLKVDSIERVIADTGARVLVGPQINGALRKAVIQDPDGHKLELTEVIH